MSAQPMNNTPPQVSIEEILEAVEKRQQAREAKAAASPWDLIPKRWRPWVAAFLVLVGGGSAGVLANAKAIWELPGRVDRLETKLDKIAGALGVDVEGPASRPGR